MIRALGLWPLASRLMATLTTFYFLTGLGFMVARRTTRSLLVLAMVEFYDALLGTLG